MTLVALYFLMPLALRVGLVDLPNARKQHQGQVPLIGGLAIILGLGFSSLFLTMSLSPYRSLIAGSLVLVFVGVLDDIHELSTKSRFFAEIIAGLLMTVWGGVVLYNVGNLLGIGVIHFPYVIGVFFTIFASIGIINAVNMTDGLDGFAGSLVLTQFIALAVAVWIGHGFNDLSIIILYIATLIGFLIFNFPFLKRAQAAVFMGDAGSMLLGFSLVWFLVKLSQGDHPFITPVACLWVMAIPLFETGSAIFRRVLKRQSPFKADREHIHHSLQRLGFAPIVIVFSMSVFSLLFAAIGILTSKFDVAQPLMFLIFVILFIFYFLVTGALNKKSLRRKTI